MKSVIELLNSNVIFSDKRLRDTLNGCYIEDEIKFISKNEKLRVVTDNYEIKEINIDEYKNFKKITDIVYDLMLQYNWSFITDKKDVEFWFEKFNYSKIKEMLNTIFFNTHLYEREILEYIFGKYFDRIYNYNDLVKRIKEIRKNIFYRYQDFVNFFYNYMKYKNDYDKVIEYLNKDDIIYLINLAYKFENEMLVDFVKKIYGKKRIRIDSSNINRINVKFLIDIGNDKYIGNIERLI